MVNTGMHTRLDSDPRLPATGFHISILFPQLDQKLSWDRAHMLCLFGAPITLGPASGCMHSKRSVNTHVQLMWKDWAPISKI